MSRAELPFDTGSDVETPSVLERLKPSVAANLLLYGIGGFFVLFLLWAAFAKLDQVTRGTGKVIPSSNLQVVQNLEGGIVREILVTQGQPVKKDEVLLRMDATQFAAEFAKGREGYNVLVAKITRLQAEANRGNLIFPSGLYRAAPDIVAAESNLFQARIAELNAGISVAQSRLDQARQAQAEAQGRAMTAAQARRLATEELQMIAPLVEKGIEPRIELLRAQGRVSEADGAASAAGSAAAQAQSAVNTSLAELAQIRGRYQSRAQEELTAAKAELAASGQELPALQDRMTRTDVMAPIAGTVNRVLVATLGGVVRPGEPLVEIVPRDDALLVEAQIKPADIGFLRQGQKALVKITAFNFSRYGGLDGQVSYISPDAVKDERTGETHYVIRVRTTKSVVETPDGPQPITAGMIAEVDVLGTKRSVLDYILSPIKDVGGKALRER
jgi:membrane fusion protein, adhesin transport system